MHTGRGLDMARVMESAMAQGTGAIRTDTMAFPMERMGRWGLAGTADMEDSVRHVRSQGRRVLGRPYLPIRPRGLEKLTERLRQSLQAESFLIFIRGL